MTHGWCTLCLRKVQITKRGRMRRHRYKRGSRPKAVFRGRGLCLYSGSKLLVGWEAVAARGRSCGDIVNQYMTEAPLTIAKAPLEAADVFLASQQKGLGER